MRILIFSILAALGVFFFGFLNSFSSSLFVAKIQRCTVEDFMLQHRMLYHVSLSRADVTSLNLLCPKQSDVQKTLSAHVQPTGHRS